jgi:hypothetical protein
VVVIHLQLTLFSYYLESPRRHIEGTDQTTRYEISSRVRELMSSLVSLLTFFFFSYRVKQYLQLGKQIAERTQKKYNKTGIAAWDGSTGFDPEQDLNSNYNDNSNDDPNNPDPSHPDHPHNPRSSSSLSPSRKRMVNRLVQTEETVLLFPSDSVWSANNGHSVNRGAVPGTSSTFNSHYNYTPINTTGEGRGEGGGRLSLGYGLGPDIKSDPHSPIPPSYLVPPPGLGNPNPNPNPTTTHPALILSTTGGGGPRGGKLVTDHQQGPPPPRSLSSSSDHHPLATTQPHSGGGGGGQNPNPNPASSTRSTYTRPYKFIDINKYEFNGGGLGGLGGGSSVFSLDSNSQSVYSTSKGGGGGGAGVYPPQRSSVSPLSQSKYQSFNNNNDLNSLNSQSLGGGSSSLFSSSLGGIHSLPTYLHGTGLFNNNKSGTGGVGVHEQNSLDSSVNPQTVIGLYGVKGGQGQGGKGPGVGGKKSFSRRHYQQLQQQQQPPGMGGGEGSLTTQSLSSASSLVNNNIPSNNNNNSNIINNMNNNNNNNQEDQTNSSSLLEGDYDDSTQASLSSVQPINYYELSHLQNKPLQLLSQSQESIGEDDTLHDSTIGDLNNQNNNYNNDPNNNNNNEGDSVSIAMSTIASSNASMNGGPPSQIQVPTRKLSNSGHTNSGSSVNSGRYSTSNNNRSISGASQVVINTHFGNASVSSGSSSRVKYMIDNSQHHGKGHNKQTASQSSSVTSTSRGGTGTGMGMGVVSPHSQTSSVVSQLIMSPLKPSSIHHSNPSVVPDNNNNNNNNNNGFLKDSIDSVLGIAGPEIMSVSGRKYTKSQQSK